MGDRHTAGLQTLIGTGKADFSQSRAVRALAGNKRRTTGRAVVNTTNMRSEASRVIWNSNSFARERYC